MSGTFCFGWELQLLELLQRIDNPVFITIASLLTEFGDQYIMVAILGFLYWGINKDWGKYIFINFAPVQTIPPMIKNIFGRIRPYMVSDSVKCLKAVEADYDIYDIAAQGYSFPSLHSSASAIIYGSLAKYAKDHDKLTKGLLIAAIALPLLVGWSRMYLGVHYPTDVLTGLLIGTVFIFIMDYVQKHVRDKRFIYLAVAVIALPGVFFCTSHDYFTSYGLIVGGFLGFMFEERFVNFRNTKSIPMAILRTAIGGALFLGLNVLFKLPFNEVFLDSDTRLVLIIRLFRYMAITFLVLGVYPMSFRFLRVKDKEI